MSEQKPEFTHAELLFALEIRHFAQKIRSEHAPSYLYGAGEEESRNKWYESNPLEPFVRMALEEAAATAAIIRRTKEDI